MTARAPLSTVLALVLAGTDGSAGPAPAAAPELKGVWNGVVRFPGLEVPARIRLFEADGALAGAMDVPSSRSFDLPLESVSRDGAQVRFELPVSASRRLRFDGKVRDLALAGTVRSRGAEGEFTFTRFDGPPYATAEASMEWPARPRDAWPARDWPTSTPDAEGLDAGRLAAAIGRLETATGGALRALLVVKNGRLVFERYYAEARADTPFNVKSVGKSVVSALTGIALERGLFRGTDQRLEEILKEQFRSIDDARKRAMTLEHLLTMTAGLEWLENGPFMFDWVRSADAAQTALSLEMAAEPGREFEYSSAVSHLLAAGLATAGRTRVRDFAQEALFTPIGARIHRWDSLGPGIEFGGSELFLTARDLARFGFLYLNRGLWEERQVVPRAWVEESVRVHARGDPFLGRYGYLWWLGQDGSRASFFASGAHGQIVHVVPSADLLVVACSSTRSAVHHLRPFMSAFVEAASPAREEAR